MLPFIRSDLSQLTAYTPHPEQASSALGGTPATVVATEDTVPLKVAIDRVDTNENPYDLPEQLKEKLGRTYLETIEANRYPDGEYGALKQAIAQYVNESASLANPILPTQISVGNGSDELIRSVLIATCLGSEGAILVANPTFSMYGILAQTLGIPVVNISRHETDFAIDLESAQKALESTHNPAIRVLFVVHPNSPTANSLTPSELDWLRSLPEEILVVIDEAYFEFSQTSVVQELEKRPNWLIFRTFSKAFRLAAHRVGYAIAHPELIATLEKVRLPYNLPSFSQAAAQIALAHRHELLEVIPSILAERDRLLAAFQDIPQLQVWESSANFIYVRPRVMSLAQVAHQLKSEGTSIRQTGGGLRISIGTPEENSRTLTRLKAVLTN
ncbi:histidinol-phosphate transaminase [Merismopedia glauca]|uniref:Histidinol-phosphate aminotransferase n=1 Tax=Merismopedia glauca CCAP 1448/3 TaxID=1296344 RepID=A0A2T1C5R4_9CYAN|nr:histidinol-phosphate transaminase [Merismopedia glauca]PSB03477.1 histidinol-phosphate aminotransferase [Merismopedia glauca CCAP 1448/3]